MKRDIKAIVILGGFIALLVMPFNDVIIAAALNGGLGGVGPSLLSPLNLIVPPADQPPADNPPVSITVAPPPDSTPPTDPSVGSDSQVGTLSNNPPADTQTPLDSTPPPSRSDSSTVTPPPVVTNSNSSPDPVPVTVLKSPSSGSNTNTATDTRTPPILNTPTSTDTRATPSNSNPQPTKKTNITTINNVSGNPANSSNNTEENLQTCPPVNEAPLLNKPQICSVQTKTEPVVPEPPTYLFGMMLVGLLIFYLVRSLSTAAEIKKKEKNFEANLKESMRKKLILNRTSSYKNLLKLAMDQINNGKELNLAEFSKASARIELIGSSEMRKLSSSLNKIIFDPSKKSQLGKIVEQLSNQIKKES